MILRVMLGCFRAVRSIVSVESKYNFNLIRNGCFPKWSGFNRRRKILYTVQGRITLGPGLVVELAGSQLSSSCDCRLVVVDSCLLHHLTLQGQTLILLTNNTWEGVRRFPQPMFLRSYVSHYATT